MRGIQMKTLLKAFALAGLVIAPGVQAAHADGYPAGGSKDVVLVPDTWWQPGDFFVRVRGEAVLPQYSSSNWYLGGDPFSGGNIKISSSGIAEIDFSYF